jgi:hypothetical protein
MPLAAAGVQSAASEGKEAVGTAAKPLVMAFVSADNIQEWLDSAFVSTDNFLV